jgi:hypothetical protein
MFDGLPSSMNACHRCLTPNAQHANTALNPVGCSQLGGDAGVHFSPDARDTKKHGQADFFKMLAK